MTSNTQKMKDHLQAAEVALDLEVGRWESSTDLLEHVGLSIAHSLLAIAIKTCKLSAPYGGSG